MQVLEIAVVEKQGFIHVEGDGAPRGVVEDVQRVAGKGERVCAVEEDSGEEFERGGVGGEELRWGEAGGGEGVVEEDADVRGFADVGDVVAGLGVAVGGCFFDVVDFGLAANAGGVVGARCLDGVDEAGISCKYLEDGEGKGNLLPLEMVRCCYGLWLRKTSRSLLHFPLVRRRWGVFHWWLYR